MTPDLSLNYERQIEIPLLKDYCLRKKAEGATRVFDIGGSESTYLGWLLDQGFHVTVLDPCMWPDNQTWPRYMGHPNFSIIKQGIEKHGVAPYEADFALLISVLEHLGRGGYNTQTFLSPEVTCFEHIEVPFCFTTPVGQDHLVGNPPDRNYSQDTLRDCLKQANKTIAAERFYVAPDWKQVEFDAVKDLRYAQLLGNGASAVGYYEIL